VSGFVPRRSGEVVVIPEAFVKEDIEVGEECLKNMDETGYNKQTK